MTPSIRVRGGVVFDSALRSRLRRRAARILRVSGVVGVEWSIVFTDDDEVRDLNRRFRSIDATTDVLSFSPEEDFGPGVLRLLGDVVVSVEQAARQTPDNLEAELVRLLVHGFCHLLGHDHQRARDRTAMQREEERILSAFGLTSGLVSRSSEDLC